MKSDFSLLAGVMLCLTSNLSFATPMMFTFDGVVTGATGILASKFAGGESLKGQYVLETSTPDTFAISLIAGVYEDPVTFFKAIIGEHIIGMGTDSRLTVLTDDGSGAYETDKYELQINNPEHASLSSAMLFTEFFTLDLRDSSKNAFSTDVMPLQLQSSSFDSRDWALELNGGTVFGVIQNISAVSVSVPEPTSVLLATIGLAAMTLISYRTIART